MTLSVRLDDKTKRRLSRYARDQRVSQSEVVRQALDDFLNRGAPSDGMSVYEKMKHVIGSVRSGQSDLSENTSEKFYQIVLEKHRRRQK